MKALLIVAFLMNVLPMPVGAAENGSQKTNSAAAAAEAPPQKESTAGHPSQAQASADPNRAQGDNDEGTLVVNVWSSADPVQKLSPTFAAAGLTAASRMQNTERRMEQSIMRGYPLGEFWIQLDFDNIDDSLRLAGLAASNDADRQALQQIQTQAGRLRLWSDWLIEQNRQLRLANYYISPSTLDNDEQFQKTLICTNSLLSMLGSGRLQEENPSCR